MHKVSDLDDRLSDKGMKSVSYHWLEIYTSVSQGIDKWNKSILVTWVEMNKKNKLACTLTECSP